MLASVCSRRLLGRRIATGRTLPSFHTRLDQHSHLAHRIPTLPSTVRCTSNSFHSQLDNPATASVLNSFKASSPVSQTLSEKIVQKHTVGLPDGKLVKSGDYVTLRPHKCMTHDKLALHFCRHSMNPTNHKIQFLACSDQISLPRRLAYQGPKSDCDDARS